MQSTQSYVLTSSSLGKKLWLRPLQEERLHWQVPAAGQACKATGFKKEKEKTGTVDSPESPPGGTFVCVSAEPHRGCYVFDSSGSGGGSRTLDDTQPTLEKAYTA